MVSVGYEMYKVLEDHVSVDFAKTVYNTCDRYWYRPGRYVRAWWRWLMRAEDRKYLAGAWKLKPWVAAYLDGRFGYKEWDCARNTGGGIMGFIPIVRDEKGRKCFIVVKMVYDMRAVRGYAEMDLERLELRG